VSEHEAVDSAGETGGTVLALVPAKDEAERVGATVRALRALPGVAEVLVVSDGSTDATAAEALEAGAHCLDLPRNLGKGGALNAGLAALMGRVAERLSPEPAALLLADADLAETAGRLGRLLDPVLAGEADLAIADLPAQQGAGGFGVAMGLARWGMARATGRRMAEPLSGQRVIRWEALPALLPFAPGFGIEVGMTIDALRAGLRVVEVGGGGPRSTSTTTPPARTSPASATAPARPGPSPASSPAARPGAPPPTAATPWRPPPMPEAPIGRVA
jgi:hypothetical protein